MTRTWVLGLPALLSVALLGCQRSSESDTASTAAPAARVTTERLLNAANEPSQWMTYGGTYEEQRFSRLTQINRDNVKDLGLVWFADYDTRLQQQGTPLFVDGALYVSTAWSKVYAFDAKTGRQLWKFDPKVPGEWGVKVCCGLVNKGIAAYEGKIYVGTLDARLIAIDAATGKEVWSTYVLDTQQRDDPLQRYSITMAPRVVKGKVVIGASGGEFGVRGFIAAYDAATGEQVWRFYTVPGEPGKKDGMVSDDVLEKIARPTWGNGDWWKVGGGGTVWDAAVYDPKTDLLFFGTGNGTPWNQDARDPSGKDNLFLASIIAVKPDTGEYVWHYQAVPADTWDYDSVSPMMLLDLNIGGKERRVIAQPNKNGFYYVLDATTGELLLAEPFVEVNWADGVDMKTGRPRVRPEARYRDKPFNLHPGVQGAHGWHANAYSPDTGLIYVPTQVAWFPMIRDRNYKPSDVGFNLAIDFGAQFTFYRDNPTAPSGFRSYLKAMDPATGKEVWRSELNQNGPTGGALATAGGLVFQGDGNGEFRAFDAKTGEKLWSYDVQTGVIAPPISFEIDGTQYVAVSVGGNNQLDYYAPNYSRMLVFALGGTVQLPPKTPFTPRPLDPPPATAAPEVVDAGRDRYSRFCAGCHGQEGQTRGASFPNLTRTPLLHSQQGFDEVVLKGALSANGMASFADVLGPEDTQAIRAFLIHRANELKNAPSPFGPGGQPPRSQQQHEDPSAR